MKTKKTDKKAPLKACIFSQMCDVQFEKDSEPDDNSFAITAYSGEIIKNHWWWGNVAFDLQGMSFAKKKTGILEEHFRDKRIGFSTKQDISDKVSVEGKFLSNEDAQKLRSDMREGFPMQASLRLPPTVIEHVKEGATVKVNGHTLRGPGTVFRQSKIEEVSMCVLGTDSSTESKAFAEGGKQEIEFNVLDNKETDMAKERTTELTAETFAADNPELFKQITDTAKAEGAKQVRDEFEEFAGEFGDDPAFCIEQFKAGAKLDEAVRAQNAKLKEKNKKITEAAKNNSAEIKTDKVDPAEQEFSDDAGKTPEKPKADTEEGWRKEFADSPKRQKEFGGSADDYVAFKKAEKAELIE